MGIALYFIGGCTLLVFEKVLGEKCLSPNLERRLHDDFPRYLRWIPRRATSWRMVQPPTMIVGNQTTYCAARNGKFGPRAVPARGEWQISAVQVREHWPFFFPYLAVTSARGWHARFGCRWDELDEYYSFPSFTIKKIRFSGTAEFRYARLAETYGVAQGGTKWCLLFTKIGGGVMVKNRKEGSYEP